MRTLIFLACSFCIPFFAHAEDAAIERLFRNAGIDGTIVIESLGTGQSSVHNDRRSKQAYAAASTFKVLNTLIALEEGVIAGADASFRWDGIRHEIADWNRDQTLESAFKVSCVWCYQQLARRVGALKYPAYIRQVGYGQLRQSFDETTFWLDGALTISAAQQVAFLRQLVERKLPFRASSYDTLKKIMLTEETTRYRLYAKTGWATRNAPAVGWYVGYVETLDDVWLFALNLATRDAKDLPLRAQIAKEALQRIGALPPN
ncbi:OXA-48 family carbapenem-hydrolyzing class D beta-lactamase OXA-54 [Rhodocyclaceae bacterium]